MASFEVLAQSEKDGIVIIQMLSHLKGGVAPEGLFPTMFFHDHKQLIMIIGDEAPNWRERLDVCLASPIATKPEPNAVIDRMLKEVVREFVDDDEASD